MMDMNSFLTSGAYLAAVLGALWAVLKTDKGRKFVANLLLGPNALDAQLSKAVETSVSALQAALDLRASEHVRMHEEIVELRFELSELRNAHEAKERTISALKGEITKLKNENARLRKLIEEVGS